MTNLKKNAIENIKGQYFSEGAYLMFFCIISSFLCIAMLIIAFKNINSIDNESGLIFIIFSIIFGCSAFFFGKPAITSLHYYYNPHECNICRIYGNIDNIIEEINKTYWHDDPTMVISKNYIISKVDYRNLFLYDNILGIYIQQHKTNHITDKYKLIVTDKYNNIAEFCYLPQDKMTMEETYSTLIKRCKNAKFGYTQETLQYIKNNIKNI